MARVFRSRRQTAPFAELNVTNLVDIGFTLLIIFMITTPLIEQTIDVELPVESEKVQSKKDPEKTEVIGIDARGKVYWGDREVTKDELQTLLENASMKPVQPIISLRADKSLDYQSVIDVLGQIEQAGLTKLSIDTQVGVGEVKPSRKKK